MTLKQRIAAPTPSFFKKLQKIGLGIAAAGTAIVSMPVALPAVLAKIAGYCILAGSVTAAVSQATTGLDDTQTVKQDE